MRPRPSFLAFHALAVAAAPFCIACVESTAEPPAGSDAGRDRDGGAERDAALPLRDAALETDAARREDTGPSSSALAPCPDTTSGRGTEHRGDLTADETWSAAQSPHRVTSNLRLLATLTLEECATVLVGEGLTISVGSGGLSKGALVARGRRGVDASGAPIRRAVTIAALDPLKPWGSIGLDPESRLDLESTVLRDGAKPETDQNSGGVILAYGPRTGTALNKNVRVVDVRIENARGYGVNLLRYAAFTDDSKDLVVANAGRKERAASIVVAPSAVGTIPSGFAATGSFAAIEVTASGTSASTDRFKAFGVPYLVSGRLRVAPPEDGPPATLTIDPGVTLRFADVASTGLQIGTSEKRQGILVAAGTASAPITFTSAKSPAAAGDWSNIYFVYSPALGNRIEHAVVAYAGAPSGAQGYGCGPAENDASVLLLAGRPTEAFIRSTRFENGAGDTGILLGWRADASGPDFLATNTFAAMPACRVSRWRSETGPSCPGSVDGSPVCF